MILLKTIFRGTPLSPTPTKGFLSENGGILPAMPFHPSGNGTIEGSRGLGFVRFG
jgi:hypothetical protein